MAKKEKNGKIILTPEEEKYIVENAMKEGVKSMARKLGISNSVVYRIYREYDIQVPKSLHIKFRADGQRKPLTTEEDQFIIANISHMSQKQIATQLNRSSIAIGKRCKELGLSDIIQKKIEDSYFKKGHTPFNKGLSLSEYMAPDKIERTKKTRFKKGKKPPNTLPLWSESIRTDTSGRQYIYIKVPGRRKLIEKHIWLWEKHHGKVPEGFNVVFRNGNSLDVKIENLECISNSELMRRNSIHNYPLEIKETIRLRNKITKQIKAQTK